MTLTQINKAGLDEIALDHVFTIGASGTDHYTFQGEGLNGTVNDPTLYLTRGKTYRFENGSGGHPIRIQSTSGASGTAYNTGVTNNAGSGTVIVEVQHDAPDVLYYQCTSHANMNGVLYITGALADGGVTTAKIADDAVTDAKLANSINSAIAANTAKTSNATHTGDVTGSTSLTIANNAVTTGKIADDAVNSAKIADGAINSAAMLSDNLIQEGKIQNSAISTAKIADGAVTDGKIGAGQISVNKLANGAVHGSKIADQAVTLDKLPHGTSSNNGKFLRANNGADPTFETVNTDLVSDTSPQLGSSLDTNGNNISFVDSTGTNSNRATFGTGNDLAIYHQSNVSHIHESGTGPLRLSTDEFQLMDSGQTKTAIYAPPALGVSLNYNGNTKLQTLNTGTQITGKLGVNKSPSSAIDIQSGTNENGLNLNCIGTPANYFLNVRDDNVSKFYIKSDGKVGVNTDAPSTTLSVINDSADEGINVKHSNLTKGVNIGFEKIQTVGTASDISLDIQAKGASANLRCGIDGYNVFGAQQDSRDFRIFKNKQGWSTLQMDADGGITGPLRRHVRRMNNGQNSVATINLFRLRRYNWGSGFFEVRMYATYYTGSLCKRFRIMGHGAHGNHYSVKTLDDNFTDGNSADWGVGCQVTSGGNSAPGDNTVYYTDVQVTIPNYWYGLCELVMSSGYQTNNASAGTSMATNSYTLWS